MNVVRTFSNICLTFSMLALINLNQASAQTTDVCISDASLYCPGMTGSQRDNCLNQYFPYLSQACQGQLSTPPPVVEEEPPVETIAQTCSKEIANYCSKLKRGFRNFNYCLWRFERKLSTECKSFLANVYTSSKKERQQALKELKSSVKSEIKNIKSRKK